MIGWLSGIVRVKRPPVAVIDVNGVGYELEAPMSTFGILPAIGGSVELHTHLVVRDDAHALYAFATENERISTALNRSAQHLLGSTPAVCNGRIEEVNPAIESRGEHAQRARIVRARQVAKRRALTQTRNA